MKTIRQLQAEVDSWADRKGWKEGFTPANIPEKLCLIHSEVSEAMECHMLQRRETTLSETGKPEGLPSEIADVVIRVMQLCGCLDIDLELTVDLVGLSAEWLDRYGWSDGHYYAPEERLGLIHCEITAALEAYRDRQDIRECLAGVVIRCEQFSRKCKFDLWAEVEQKMAYNEKRPYKHGNRQC